MNQLGDLLQKARNSKWNMWILNWKLHQLIPFNKPHNIRVTEIMDDGVTISAKFKKANKNHINGIHACLLATISEYATGLTLLSKLPSKQYRLILKSIAIEYHYQAKSDVSATFTITHDQMNDILNRLKNTEKTLEEVTVHVYDLSHNHICTTKVNWQLKNWDAVKTKK